MTTTNECQDWLKKIESRTSSQIRLGLERAQKVSEKENLHVFNCPVVMIAGTNGKGSTLAILAKLLQEAGLRVGTYTSPHLLDFRERVQIQGQFCAETDLISAFEKIESLRGETELTYFEFITLAAFALFQEKQDALDFILLEVGLGGRLDVVNLVRPSLAIITSIGHDHQDKLGDSLERIAFEKAGIIRENIPVVLGETAGVPPILAITRQKGNTVYQVDEQVEDSPHLPANSLSLARTTFNVLQKKTKKAPMQVLKNVGMVGRYQPLIVNDKQVILDVAHNAQSAIWLSEKLNQKVRQGKLLAVWASLADKDLPAIVQPFLANVTKWYVGGMADNHRASSLVALQRVLHDQGIPAVSALKTIGEAFESALEEADKKDCILVFGSFFTVAVVLKRINFHTKNLTENGLYHLEEEKLRWA